MDPSIALTLIKNSFSGISLTYPDPPEYTFYPVEEDEGKPFEINYVLTFLNSPPLVNPTLYNEYNKVYKEIRNNLYLANVTLKLETDLTSPDVTLREIKQLSNPYRSLGLSVFADHQAIIMANLDSLFNFTETFGGFLGQSRLGRFSFLDLFGGELGGVSQYIQFKRPESTGYSYGYFPNPDILDMNNYSITDTEFYPEETANRIAELQAPGLDLVLSNGKPDYSFNGLKNIGREIMNNDYLNTLSSVIALKTLRPGGNFLLYVQESFNRYMVDLIYILSTCFEKVSAVKPLSIDPYDNSKYFYFSRLRNDSRDKLLLLRNSLTPSLGIKYNGLTTTVYPEFRDWLLSVNDECLQESLRQSKRLSDLVKGNTITVENYNMYRALVLWNLPDTCRTRDCLISKRQVLPREYLSIDFTNSDVFEK